MDRIASKPGNRVGAVLRQEPRGMCNGEQQKQSGDEAGFPSFPSHGVPRPCLDYGKIRRKKSTCQSRALACQGYDPKLKVFMKNRS
jgi:hypothetical protein